MKYSNKSETSSTMQELYVIEEDLPYAQNKVFYYDFSPLKENISIFEDQRLSFDEIDFIHHVEQLLDDEGLYLTYHYPNYLEGLVQAGYPTNPLFQQITSIADNPEGITYENEIADQASFSDEFIPTTISFSANLFVSESSIISQGQARSSIVIGPSSPLPTGSSATFSLTLINPNSGIIDTQSGQEVNLTSFDNTIIGTIVMNGTQTEVLRISIDSQTGQFDFDLSRGVEHDAPGNDSLGVPVDKVQVVIETLSSEGGPTTHTLDVSEIIQIIDDVPTVTSNAASLPVILLDESLLTSAPQSSTITVSAAFTVMPGADGANPTNPLVYDLRIISNGVDSGLVDTLSQQPILLQQQNNTVFGTILINGNSVTVFDISLNSAGDLTYSLYRAVEHNQPGIDTLTLPAGVIFVDVTVSDGDGDSAQASLDVGPSLGVIDDVPVIDIEAAIVDATPTTDSINEGGGSLNGTWQVDAGVDGLGSIAVVIDADGDGTTETYALNIPITVRNDAQEILGQLTVNDDNTWQFVPGSNINQSDNSPDIFDFQLIVTDGDGDTANDTHTINVLDGLPPQVEASNDTAELTVDEANVVQMVNDNVTFNAGSDALSYFGFSTDLTDLQTNTDGVAGDDVVWTRVSDTLIEGYVGANLAMSIALTPPAGNINPFTSGDVNVTVTLSDGFNHVAANGKNNFSVTGLIINAVDTDGDTAQASISILVIDGTPSIDILPADANDGTPTTDTVVAGDTNGLSGNWNSDGGADGVNSIVVQVDTDGDGIIESHSFDTDITIRNSNGDTLGTLRVNSSPVNNPDWVFIPANSIPTTSTFNFNLLIEDTDGDTASDSHTITVLADNDGVDPANPTAEIAVDERDINDSDDDTITFVTGVNPFTSFIFSPDLSAMTVNTDGQAGADVVWTRVSNSVVEGRVNGDLAITLTLTAPASIAANSSGDVSVAASLTDNFIHLAGNGNNSLTISGLSVIASDGVDNFPAAVIVTVIDDNPSISIEPAVADSSPATDTVAEDGAAINGTWLHDGGADGVAQIELLIDSDGDGNSEIFLIDHTNPAFIQSVDVFNSIGDQLGTLVIESSGDWTFTPALGVDNDDIYADSFGFTMRITDNDGDTQTDTHTIDVTDGTDGQLNPANNSVQLNVNEANINDSSNDTVTFDAGSDPLIDFIFSSNLSSMTVNTDGNPGPDVVWNRVNDGLIEGSVDGQLALTISLIAPASIAAGASGNVTVTADLTSYFQHLSGNGANTVTIAGLDVIASDHDGGTVAAPVEVSVIDDVPTVSIEPAIADASPADDSVAEDGMLNGVWTRDGGADGIASITIQVDSNDDGIVESYTLDHLDVNSSVIVSVTNINNDQLGTLTVRNNGSWIFEPELNVNQADGFVDSFDFSVIVTDGDGDSAVDTHTVSVVDGTDSQLDPANNSIDLSVDEALIDDTDSDTATFNAGSDDLTIIRFSQNLSTMIVNTDGNPGADVTWIRVNDNQIEGYVDGDLALTLNLIAPSSIAAQNTANVSVNAILSDNFFHLAGNGTNTVSITGLTVDAFDQENEITQTQVTITIIDDVPVITVGALSQDFLQVDETVLNSPVSANFSVFYTFDAGADEEQSRDFQLIINNTSTGLTDTLSGEAITLSLNAGVIEARTVTSNDLVFTLSVASDGNVTLNQLRSIVHPDTTSANDEVSLPANTIGLIASLTDNDNDSTSSEIDISLAISLLDDGPSINAGAVLVADSLNVDETNLAVDATANFADNFAPAISFGADGAGSIVYALALAGSDVGSGLFAIDNTDTTAGDGDGIGQGAEIVLNQAGNVITGSVGGTDYFTITINPATGDVTFDQLAAIWHQDTGNPDDLSTLTTANANDLTLTATVFDGDGDSATHSLNLGQGLFSINDDGPSVVTPTALSDTSSADLSDDLLIVDESAGQQANPVDNVADRVSSVDLFEYFDSDSGDGQADLDVDYGSDGPGTNVFSLALLDGVGAAANGIGSGLYALDNSDTSAGDGDGIGQGQEILLFVNGNTIEGRTVNAAGDLYFTISNTGSVLTLTQNSGTSGGGSPLNIWHADTADSDDNASLTGTAGDGVTNYSITLNQTVTDADGDSVQTTLNLTEAGGDADNEYLFNFRDDGPSINAGAVLAADTLNVDETNFAVDATANFADNFAPAISFGADGAGSIVYALALAGSDVGSGLFAIDNTDTTAGDGDGIGQGAEIVLNQAGNVITGSVGGTDYFTITINPATGDVTFNQLAAIWHQDTGNPDDLSTLTTANANDLTLTATVFDGDGDSASFALNLGQNTLSINDDGPSINAGAVLAADTLNVDETNLAVDAVVNFADNFAAAITYGNDGAGSIVYSLALAGSDVGSGLFAIDNTDTTAGDGDGIGQGAEIVLNQAGNVITGSVGGTDYFTITINPATGDVTFDQLAAIWHQDTGNPDDLSTLTTANANDLTLTATVFDGDGDSATHSLNLGQGLFSINDDGPSVVTPTALSDTSSADLSDDLLIVDESAGQQANPVDNVADRVSSVDLFEYFDSDSGDGQADLDVDYGSDGPGTNVFSLALLDGVGAAANGIGSGLYALDNSDTSAGDGDGIGQGQEILLFVNGNTIEGRTVNAAGDLYFTISNTGSVLTLTQNSGTSGGGSPLNIWHADTADSDDNASLTGTAGDGVTNYSITLNQTVTDADGDSVQTTLNLTEAGGDADNEYLFNFRDDGPSINAGAVLAADTLNVDETNFAVDATANFADNFAPAISFGADGAGSIVYALALAGSDVGSGLFAIDNTDTTAGDGDGIGQGAEIVLNQAGNVITGSVGGTDYFTITINPATGDVTFNQLAAIWHQDTGNPDDLSTLTTANANDLTLTATVFDGDGDSASFALNLGQNTLSINDDGPSINAGAVLAADTLNVDETNLAVDAVVNFADNFAAAITYGNDGAGSIVYSLALAGSDVGSGLFAIDNTDTTAGDGDGIGQGAEIVLNQAGNVITGSVGGTDYFTITINPATGDVTFDQLAAIWHQDTGNPDDLSTLTTANANDLTLTATVFDGDGDSATHSLNLGQGLFSINDDGPSVVTPTALSDTSSADLSDDLLIVDESAGQQANPVDNVADRVSSVDLFEYFDSDSGDGQADLDVDYGSDGPGTNVFSLALLDGVGAAANGIGSGLYALDNSDTSAGDGDGIGQGQEILLFVNGNTIEGRTVNAAGDLYFTISNTGSVLTLTQNSGTSGGGSPLNIWHADTADSDDNASLTGTAGDGVTNYSITLNQTVTDADGDSVQTTLNLTEAGGDADNEYLFNFRDDGPSINAGAVLAADTLNVDETNFAVDATANFADNFAPAISFGTDGAGSIVYALALAGSDVGSGLFAIDNTDTTAGDGDGVGQGAEIVLNQAGNVITGSVGGTDYFTITINPATGDVTFDQLAAIWHQDTGNPDDLSTLTTTNANDLTLTATVFDADGDSATHSLNLGQGLFSINDDGPSVVTPTALSDTSSADLSDDLLIVDESAGQQANPVDNVADRVSSVDLYEYFDSDSGDGQADLDVDYGSDGPGTNVFSLALLDGVGAAANGIGSGLYALDNSDTSAGDGDGIGQGQEILLFVNGNTIEGRTVNAAGDLYFTISNTGSVLTLTQNSGTSGGGSPLNIWHADTADSDDNASLTGTAGDGVTNYSITLNQTVTDADGDSVQTTLNLTEAGGDADNEYLFNFRDDGPSINAGAVLAADTLNVDETNFAVDATANFADNFAPAISFGTDGAGSIVYALALAGSDVGSGLFAIDNTDTTAGDGDGVGQGAEIVLNQAGNVITGSVGGTDYFTITINPATGDVTFDQLAAIWHQDTGNPDDLSTLTTTNANDLTLTATVFDADGDSATHSLNLGQGLFSINDDGPSVVTPTALSDTSSADLSDDLLIVDESAGQQANPVDNVADRVSSVDLYEYFDSDSGDGQADLDVDYGSDGPGTNVFSLALLDGVGAAANGIGSGLYALDNSDTSAGDGDGIGQGQEILLFVNGNTIEGRTVNAAGDLYFTISNTGSVLTLTQNSGTSGGGSPLNIWHADTADSDDNASLTGTAGDGVTNYSITLNQTVTDADGDSVQTTLNLTEAGGDADNEYLFNFRDAGPSVVTPTALSATSSADLSDDLLIVDESAGQQANPVDNVADRVSSVDLYEYFDSDSGDGQADLDVDYGSDGPGTNVFSLALLDGVGSPANGIGSGLYALDNSDTTAGDGDGIGQGQEILLFVNGNTIEGRTVNAAGDLYFTISNTGSVLTLTQNSGTSGGGSPLNIWHADTADSDDNALLTGTAGDGVTNYSITLNQTVTDADGDSVQTTLNLTEAGGDADNEYLFNFRDAGPSVVTPTALSATSSADLSDDLLIVDESAGQQANPVDNVADRVSSVDLYEYFDSDSGDGQADLDVDYGSDGPGTNVFSLALLDGVGAAANGIGSGLYALDNSDTTAGDGDGIGQGQEILLFVNGNTIEGRTVNAAGDLYFTISNTGSVLTLTQNSGTSGGGSPLNIWHADTADSDDNASLTGTAGDGVTNYSITLNQTVTDADGDSVQTTLNLTEAGGDADNEYLFNFRDAGPSVVTPTALSATSSADLSDDLLIVDESAGQQANPVDNVADRVSSVDLFEYFDSDSGDGQADLDVDYGSDGPGTNVFSLALLDGVGAAANGIGSGLYALDNSDTSAGDGDGIGQGQEILLFVNGNTIEGRTVNAAGDLYFTISNTGSVLTLTQNSGTSGGGSPLNIWHADTADSDDNASLTGTAGDGVTNYSITLNQTVTDADGDSVQTTLNLTEAGGDADNEYLFNFRDDGPSVVTPTALSATSSADLSDDLLIVDESAGQQANPVDNVADRVSSVDLFEYFDSDSGDGQADLDVDYGSDGPGTNVFSLALLDGVGAAANGIGSGLYALDNSDTSAGDGDGIGQGQEILLFVNGNTIEGRTVNAAGDLYFTISNTGSVLILTQNSGTSGGGSPLNIWHADTADSDDNASLTGTAGDGVTNYSITLNQTVTDADGDSVQTTLNLTEAGGDADNEYLFNFRDDGPSINAGAVLAADTLNVDETNFAVDAVVNFADNFAPAISFGTDGAGSIVYALALAGSDVGSGLFAIDNTDTTAGDGDGIGQGTEIVLNQAGNVITGSVGGTDYFTITINPATGDVTFNQLAAIWHQDTGNPDDLSTLTTANANDLTLTATVFDGDGDSASFALNLGQNILSINDDGPSINAGAVLAADTLNVDETNFAVDAVVNFADNFAAAITYGNDGAGSIVYSLALAGSDVGSGLFAIDNTDTTAGDGDGIGQGAEIVLNQVGNVITGSVGGTDYFTITINPATGDVTFDQLAAIWHQDTGNPDDLSTLTTTNANDLTLTATLTDADGDSVSFALNLGQNILSINDDGPVTTNVAETQTVNETSDTVSGNLLAQVNFNNDGQGFFQLVAAADLATTTLPNITSFGENVVYQIIGNVLYGVGADSGVQVFSLTIEADGDYTFTLDREIDHPPGSTTLSLDFSDAILAFDADGDPVALSSGVLAEQFVIDVVDNAIALYLSTVGGGAATTLLEGYYGMSAFAPIEGGVDQLIIDLLAPGGLLFGSGLTTQDVLDLILAHEGIFSSSDILRLGADGTYEMAFNSSENFDFETLDGDINALIETTGLDVFNILSFYGYDIDALHIFNDDDFLFSFSLGMTDIINLLPPGLDTLVTNLLNLTDFGSEDVLRAQRQADGSYNFSIFFDGDVDGGLVDGTILDAPLSPSLQVAVDFDINGISYEGDATNGTLYFSLGELIDVDLEEFLETTLGLQPDILGSTLINGADVLSIDRVGGAWDTSTYELVFKGDDVGLNDVLLGNALQALGDPGLATVVARLLDPDIQVIDIDSIHLINETDINGDTVQTLYFSLRSLLDVDLPFGSIGELLNDPLDPLAAVSLRGEDIIAISTNPGTSTWNANSVRLYFDGSVYELNANEELISGIFDNLVEDINAFSLSHNVIHEEVLLFSTEGGGNEDQVGGYDGQTLIQNYRGQFINSFDLSARTGGSVTNQNINATHVLSSGILLFSLNAQATLPDIGLVDENTVIQWDGSTFSTYFTVADSDTGGTLNINSFYVIEGAPDNFLFSIEQDATINGTDYSNHDIIRYDGVNYSHELVGTTAGINDLAVSIDVNAGVASGVDLGDEIDTVVTNLFQPLVDELQALFDAIYNPIDSDIDQLETILNTTTLLGSLLGIVADVLNITTTLTTNLLDGILGGDLSQDINNVVSELSDFITDLDNLSPIDTLIQDLDWVLYGGVAGVRALAQGIVDDLSDVAFTSLVGEIDTVSDGIAQVTADLNTALDTDTSLDFTLIDTRIDGLHQLPNGGDYLLSFAQQLVLDLQLEVNLDSSFIDGGVLAGLGVTVDTNQLISDINVLLDTVVDPVLGATDLATILQADVDLIGSNIYRYHDDGGGDWDVNLYYDGADHGLDNASTVDTLLDHIDAVLGANATLEDIQDNLNLLQLATDENIDAVYVFDESLSQTTLNGSVANDILVGTQANDTLYSNLGDDLIFGLSGANQFVFDDASSGGAGAVQTDTIADFKAGDELIFFEDIFGGASVNDANLDTYVTTNINGSNTELTVLNAGLVPVHAIILTNFLLDVPIADISTVSN